MLAAVRRLAFRFAVASATCAPILGHCAVFDGRALSAVWGLPFAGLLLCIALMPLVAAQVWHHHYGKIAAAWALLFLVPFAVLFGPSQAAQSVVHAAFGEYLPFVILITALFTVAGGIHIRGNLRGTPSLNAGILVIGAVLASLMGTTGASMLLIRPLIRANDSRRHKAHVVVFFIFIVSNAGGSLTPLGDPPLFLGFLQGVDFFWTLREILPETFFLVASLIAIFWAIDWFYYHRREEFLVFDPTPDTRGVGFDGARNFWLLGVIVGLVLLSGIWQTSAGVEFMGLHIGLPGLVRDMGLLAVIWLSLRITPSSAHEANHFSWEPMLEVAKLFAGIFMTIVPVIAMLRAGADGPFGGIVKAVTRADGTPDPAMYFWATGALSSFLDNAPTYLVFFNTAGGNAELLMTSLSPTLAAISAGAVFMGANSYIGNAPNLMVKAIAEHRGIRMPSFFGYMAWSICVLIPLFIVMTLIWYR
jgi:Na+/H+ antiporter NhaD/arsenite permease-like protein